jgi:hypothetical protein
MAHFSLLIKNLKPDVSLLFLLIKRSTPQPWALGGAVVAGGTLGSGI